MKIGEIQRFRYVHLVTTGNNQVFMHSAECSINSAYLQKRLGNMAEI